MKGVTPCLWNVPWGLVIQWMRVRHASELRVAVQCDRDNDSTRHTTVAVGSASGRGNDNAIGGAAVHGCVVHQPSTDIGQLQGRPQTKVKKLTVSPFTSIFPVHFASVSRAHVAPSPAFRYSQPKKWGALAASDAHLRCPIFHTMSVVSCFRRRKISDDVTRFRSPSQGVSNEVRGPAAKDPIMICSMGQNWCRVK